VGERALRRGAGQLGSLGAGNHFLEVQVVDRILDGAAADAMGLQTDQVCLMIHCGSRGLGHQVCSDHVETMQDAMSRHEIHVPDPQLACVPVDSGEGRAYLGAREAAANFALANRQLLTEAARDAVAHVLGRRELALVYDVSHNLAKLETHRVEGRDVELCVHRKGATRAFPPGSADLPDDLRSIGQPVLLPGSMGTASYVLAGLPNGGAFGSAAHGAGRRMSRNAAKRHGDGGPALRDELSEQGVEAQVTYDADLGLVLPEGNLARE
jgi:tRNA-splicing ligase RtcB (3'-phosphate/5'-hydroxy nucleic acid ligase)